MEISLLLPLANRGIPGVLQVSSLDMSERGRCEGFLPELINHARATSLVQLIVNYEAHQKPEPEVLQRRLDVFALEDEVFTVSEPVLVEDTTYRIDVHRNVHSKAEELREMRSDRTHVDPSDEVLLRRTVDLFRLHNSTAITRARNALLNAGALYLWQILELLTRSRVKGFGRMSLQLVREKLRELDCDERLLLSEAQKQRLRERSPNYQWSAES